LLLVILSSVEFAVVTQRLSVERARRQLHGETATEGCTEASQIPA
jgi:hypothetical protein